MKTSWNRLALIVGAVVLALTAIDGLAKMNSGAMRGFEASPAPLVAPGSAAALLLLGLIGGVVLGIAIFFSYLVWRERHGATQPDEVALLLEEVEAEEKRSAIHREREEGYGEDRPETLDPWERPADWWRDADEG